jgi:hypothetical protein
MKSALSVFGLFVLAIAPVQAGGHCNVQALQAFASPVVQVQQFRGARVRNQRVRSKAVTRIR